MNGEEINRWNDIFNLVEVPLELVELGQEGAGDGGLLVRHDDASAKCMARQAETNDPQELRALVAEKTADESDLPMLLLAPRVTPKVADFLRGAGVMFADERGNCFISIPGMYLDIRGRVKDPPVDQGDRVPLKRGTQVTSAGQQNTAARRLRRPARSAASQVKVPTGSLFTPRRAQVSAVILGRPELLDSPVREVARQAGVSVGSAAQTLELLTQAGYVNKSDFGGRYYFGRPKALLDAWAQSYATGLGADLEIFRGEADLGRFEAMEPMGWVSGEQAVPHLVRGGTTVHLYLRNPAELKKLLRDGRIRRSDNGNVIVRMAFWGAGQGSCDANQTDQGDHATVLGEWPCAPWPVIYADLVGTHEPRLLEVAQELRSTINF